MFHSLIPYSQDLGEKHIFALATKITHETCTKFLAVDSLEEAIGPSFRAY